ncbi:MAG: hypothetical protein GC151_16155 [Betaproteobacteria bacterium]|nr:hypothetical protein [Betaproteobacteria bacterium]
MEKKMQDTFARVHLSTLFRPHRARPQPRATSRSPMEGPMTSIHVLPRLAVLLFSLIVSTTAFSQTRASPWSESDNTNLPGNDMERIVMEAGQKDLCAEACRNNPLCRAYTWVRRNVQGPKPVCWLKSAVPSSHASQCCVSGKRISDAPFSGTFESRVDLPGRDYASSRLASADPDLCAAACANDDRCRAFTYVAPGHQGSDAMCYLKDGVPARVMDAECCTSGVKRSSLVIYERHRNTDMPGSDYDNFDVPTGGWQSCQQACAGDTRCRAYTYVKSVNVSDGGQCWLKDARPRGRAAQCCDSGVKLPGEKALNIGKGDFDLPGSDYHHFEPRGPDDTHRTTVCRSACGADGSCLAYTYVKPGIQGSKAVCYLKSRVPEHGASSQCCSSGVRNASHIAKPLGPGYEPPILDFSGLDPNREIRGHAFPRDMPAPNFPPLYRGCSPDEIDSFKAAWALAHHHMWRAQQVMQHINASSQRRTLWNHGFVDRVTDANGNFANWSPRGWFGRYDSRRFRLSRRALDKVWSERFLGGRIGSTRIRIWCRADSGVEPCTGARRGAHTGVGTLDICPAFFDNSEFSNARFIIHEMFHWLKIPKSGFWVSDSHDFWRNGCRYRAAQTIYQDDAAYIGVNGGCYDWNFNRAILTNDNYAWFARTLGERIYRGEIVRFPAENVVP